MNQSEKTKLFGQRVLTMWNENDVSWSNGPESVSSNSPRLHCQQVRVSASDATLEGNDEEEFGFFMFTVIVDSGTHAKIAEDLADQTKALFPLKLEIESPTGGFISVPSSPEVLTGYVSGSSYRVPVRIPYHSFQ